MPCIPVPTPPIPTIPLGLSISVPLPTPPRLSTPNPCCLLPVFTTPPIPISLGALAVNPAVVTAIRAALQALEAYVDQLPLKCPRG